MQSHVLTTMWSDYVIRYTRIHEHVHLWLMQIQNRRSLVTHCNIMHYHSKAANDYLIPLKRQVLLYYLWRMEYELDPWSSWKMNDFFTAFARYKNVHAGTSAFFFLNSKIINFFFKETVVC